MKRISSRQNEIVARYRSAARGNEAAILLLDGAHLVSEALGAGIRLRHAMIAADVGEEGVMRPLVERLTRSGVDVAIATAPVMSVVSPVRSPSAVVALAERPGHANAFAGDSPLVLIACDVQDPGNVGAIVRVAEAAGASGVVAAGHCADPFGWKALRGSMGSALRLPIAVQRTIDDAMADARQHRCRLVATVPRGGHSIYDAALKGAVAVLIGGEGQGLADALIAGADERVTIPMHPPVESLNAAVTAALILYEARRQRS